MHPSEPTNVSNFHGERGQLRRWSKSCQVAFQFSTDRRTDYWATEPTLRTLFRMLFLLPIPT
jgi:hypothetical protein